MKTLNEIIEEKMEVLSRYAELPMDNKTYKALLTQEEWFKMKVGIREALRDIVQTTQENIREKLEKEYSNAEDVNFKGGITHCINIIREAEEK